MTSTAPALGHNRPPIFSADELDALRQRLQELNDAAGAELTAGPIAEDDDDRSARVLDLSRAIKALHDDAEKQRKADKQPHLDACREVDDAWKDITNPADALARKAKGLLTDFAKRRQARIDAERRAAEEQARQAAAEAQRRAEEAAKRNDTIGEAEAAEAKAEAERAAEEAAAKARVKIESASGVGRAGSLRTRKTVKCVNLRAAFLTLEPLLPVDLAAALEKIARDAIRQGYDVAQMRGFEMQIDHDFS